MKKRIALVLALIISLTSFLLNGCSHKHNFIERDGRVICIDCKEVCSHEYEISGTEAYCSICLFSCKHSFDDVNGNMVCNDCGIVCAHEYDENSICKYCEIKCIHEYETTANVTRCKFCNAECEHIFENSDTCKICGNICTHEFGFHNGGYKCLYCSTSCKHEYENVSGKSVCKNCGHQKIFLTMNNVNDYFTVSAKIYDVIVDKDYILGTKDAGEGRATITVRSKKDVKYKNVVMIVTLETSSSGWTSQGKEIEISYDGYGEANTKLFSYIQDYVSDSPLFIAKITKVSGEIEI